MLELNDKIAIVTGSACGIGRGIASKMAEYGATVVVSDLDLGNVRNTVAELQSEHSAATFGAHEVDVTRVDLNESQSGLTPRERFDRSLQEITPLGREMTPEDMANLAVFLASELSRNIIGQAINVDGGYRLD